MSRIKVKGGPTQVVGKWSAVFERMKAGDSFIVESAEERRSVIGAFWSWRKRHETTLRIQTSAYDEGGRYFVAVVDGAP
ncbi:hypothetical protein UFOVP119_58 [uncultured Caudovirales phage]|uniref:Uncharacterized protein n=1 Tax=uncultured Caudovirales phage TaxID=2100421 RepID=A0A6J5L7K2_9CAUD|nr:hypothetical protein UFOVP119_58 [uncultured Caudovirales phage]